MILSTRSFSCIGIILVGLSRTCDAFKVSKYMLAACVTLRTFEGPTISKDLSFFPTCEVSHVFRPHRSKNINQ